MKILYTEIESCHECPLFKVVYTSSVFRDWGVRGKCIPQSMWFTAPNNYNRIRKDCPL